MCDYSLPATAGFLNQLLLFCKPLLRVSGTDRSLQHSKRSVEKRSSRYDDSEESSEENIDDEDDGNNNNSFDPANTAISFLPRFFCQNQAMGVKLCRDSGDSGLTRPYSDTERELFGNKLSTYSRIILIKTFGLMERELMVQVLTRSLILR
ncbi:Protein CBG10703 [Caenorhabditis briggsae]|uniref:Protein CBG10703 n=1 Tax=Caenorhabditis briggsae TaxID=6238 RepID=A8XBL5_CAEBR|nr:Protein CBG10703 [Caenorhabditis briggsae]CAP30031.1 Protein CBG10703 [Caenorhabditis briggsae]